MPAIETITADLLLHDGHVEEASLESFPASDAPAYILMTALGAPADVAQPVGPIPDPPPVEVREHTISDPASRSAGARG